MQIKKRNTDIVDFDKNKIIIAITKANNEVPETARISKYLIEAIADEIEDECNKIPDILSVEDIQDMVESYLIKYGATVVAKTYIKYRYKHEVARGVRNDFIDAVERKLKAEDVENQNANLDERTFSGRVGEATRVMTKELALKTKMSDMARCNHENNEIYIHDLDSLYVGMHNCLSIPFDDILANGFITKQTDVRPAGSVGTAMQLIAVIMQLQSQQQFGGVSATHLDWTMVPYVRKSFLKHYIFEYLKSIDEFDSLDFFKMTNEEIDEWVKKNRDRYLNEWNLTKEDFTFQNFDKLNRKICKRAVFETKREVYQSVESLYHNLNTLQSRSGGQLPFSSINYGTCTLEEGRIVTEALLECSVAGLGKFGRTSIFPCGIFQCMKGVNRKPNEPNYDLFRKALKSTAQRLYPNYANCDWSGNAGYDRNDPRTYFSTMGCRTANGADINALPGQNPQLKDGRGNICPVTIIMPTLAMEAGRDIEKFMILLDKKIHEAKDMLIERFNWICSQSPESAPFMWQNHTMYGYVPEEGIRSALKHGTLAVGQLGLAETLQLLVGCDQTEEKGMKLAKRIEQLFKERCAGFKQEYKLNFGVYYTPEPVGALTAM